MKKKGFQRWQEARNEWCGTNNSATDDTSTSAGDISLPRTAVPIDVDEVIDVLFDPRWRGGTAVIRQPTTVTTTVPPTADVAGVAVAAVAASVTTATHSLSGGGIIINTNPTSPSSVSTAQSEQQPPTTVVQQLTPRQQQQSTLPPRFPQNVPLPQMIDVLVDLWEAEGLDV
jgi:hypothetical protein